MHSQLPRILDLAQKNSKTGSVYHAKTCSQCPINCVCVFRGIFFNDGSLPSFHGIPFNEYMGQFATSLGEDEEKPIDDKITISIKEKDLAKLKKSKIKFELTTVR